MGRFGSRKLSLLFATTLVALGALASPRPAHAQANATKEEKLDEKIDRTGTKNPSLKIPLVEHKRPVITFVPVVPTALPGPYVGPIVDYKPNASGTLAPYDARTGQFLGGDAAKGAAWRRVHDGVGYKPNRAGTMVPFDTASGRYISAADAASRPTRIVDASGKTVPAAVLEESARTWKALKDGTLPSAKPVEDPKKKLAFDTDDKRTKDEKKERSKLYEKPKYGVEVAKTGATGKLGVNLDALGLKDGEVPLVPENAYVDLKLKVGQLEGTAAARANVGPDGVDANLLLEGKATLIGIAAESGKAEIGDKAFNASVYTRAEAAILAEAKANGVVQAGPDGLRVVGEAGAFAGGKAKLEVPAKVTVAGVETRATLVGEVSYGIGAEGKVYMKIDWKRLAIKGGAKGHLALGVGAGGEVDVEVSVADLAKNIAPPEATTLRETIPATQREVNPLATQWTLARDDYRKMAAAVLSEEVDRGRALAEVSALQKHFLAGLGDYTKTKHDLERGDLFGDAWTRLRQDVYDGNPDAIAGFQAAVADAKKSGAANDSRWGGRKLEDLERIVRLQSPAASRVARAPGADFAIPHTTYRFQGHVLPSHTGPRGLDPDQLLGVADWWVKLDKKAQGEVNAALEKLTPEKQPGLLKRLAENEIAARIDAAGLFRGPTNEEWMDELGLPPPVQAAIRKDYPAKAQNAMRLRWGAISNQDATALANRVRNLVLGTRVPASTIASVVFNTLIPSSDDMGRRMKNEIRLEQGTLSFGLYAQYLKDELYKAKKEGRLSEGQEASAAIDSAETAARNRKVIAAFMPPAPAVVAPTAPIPGMTPRGANPGRFDESRPGVTPDSVRPSGSSHAGAGVRH